MNDHIGLLKDKARLLIARERELFALRKAHDRSVAWLGLAQHLPEIVAATPDLQAFCESLRQRLIEDLNLQLVVFFEIVGGSTLRPITSAGPRDAPAERTLGLATRELVFSQNSGMCNQPLTPLEEELAGALGLCRLLWYRIDRLAGTPILIAAGFDQERALLNARFVDSDVAQFQQTGREIELLLRNLSLLKQLEGERRALRLANEELEHRVAARTRELALANEGLANTLQALSVREAHLADDIAQAREFQQKLLPALPVAAGIEFASVYRPLEQVGGDVFDIWQRAPDAFRIFMADATGHGVQAAMRTIWLKSEYDRLKSVARHPHALLTALSARLFQVFPMGDMMCTASCLDVELIPDGARVVYANAAHPPLLCWSGRSLREIYQPGSYLAVDNSRWTESHEFCLEPGSLLLLYSDGLVEQSNAQQEPFDALLRASVDDPSRAASARLAELMRLFDAFRGETPMRDDVTAVAVALAPKGQAVADAQGSVSTATG
jgi:serine phosphatase RsbU (regulator of sigma subunit)